MCYFCLCTGSAKCNECRRDHRQARAAFASSTQLVHPGNMCHQRRRPLRRPWLVVEPAEESEIEIGCKDFCHYSKLGYHLILTCQWWGLKLVSLIAALLSLRWMMSIYFGCVSVCVCLWYPEPRCNSAIVIVCSGLKFLSVWNLLILYYETVASRSLKFLINPPVYSSAAIINISVPNLMECTGSSASAVVQFGKCHCDCNGWFPAQTDDSLLK